MWPVVTESHTSTMLTFSTTLQVYAHLHHVWPYSNWSHFVSWLIFNTTVELFKGTIIQSRKFSEQWEPNCTCNLFWIVSALATLVLQKNHAKENANLLKCKYVLVTHLMNTQNPDYIWALWLLQQGWTQSLRQKRIVLWFLFGHLHLQRREKIPWDYSHRDKEHPKNNNQTNQL